MSFQPGIINLSFVKFNPYSIWINERPTAISKKKKKKIKTAQLFLSYEVNSGKKLSFKIRNNNHPTIPTGSKVNTDTGVFKNVKGCIQLYDRYQEKIVKLTKQEYEKNHSKIINLHSFSNSESVFDSVDVEGFFNYEEALRILDEGISNKEYCIQIPFVFTSSEDKRWKRDCNYSKNNVILEEVKFGQRV